MASVCRPTVQRTHVGFMGCHGALNGLRVANAFATADPAARVLLCAVELCSLHYYYGSAAGQARRQRDLRRRRRGGGGRCTIRDHPGGSSPPARASFPIPPPTWAGRSAITASR